MELHTSVFRPTTPRVIGDFRIDGELSDPTG